MLINRRRALLGAVAVTAVAVGGAGGLGLRWWDQPVGVGYKVLSWDEAAFLRALAGALFPPGDVIDLDGEQAELDHFVDELFVTAPALPRQLLRVLLHALDAWPLSAAQGFFTGLDRSSRQAVVDSWGGHSSMEVRSAYTTLVALLGMGYTSHERVAPLMAEWHGCGFGR